MGKKTKLILFLIGGIVALSTVAFLVYEEWAPSDNSAATIYYISPSGNDSTGNGSTNSPWKTIEKADSAISPGDTVILKDGVYQGAGQAYMSISKAGTTWRAENKHQAIIDGGFSPGALNGDWDTIVALWNNRCSDKGEFSSLLKVESISNVTIDGLFIRNSCGRGIATNPSGSVGAGDNIKFQNLRIDWTFNSAVFARPDHTEKALYPNQLRNFQFLNNIVTRASIGDEYNVRVVGACKPGVKTYCVNISTAFGGVNSVIRGNIIAWGEGEVTVQPGSTGSLFENNVLIGNKNSYYIGMVQDAVVRNNLFYSPEVPKPRAGGNEDDEAKGNWRFGLRNEEGHQKFTDVPNRNIAIYNNMIVNTSFFITGSNNNYVNNNEKIYFGNNTLIAGKELDELLSVVALPKGDLGDPVLTGIMENNIFDTRKNPAINIIAKLSGNDNFTFRNNIWPENAPQRVRGNGDVYSNDPGMINPLILLDLDYPGIGPENIDVNALLVALDINNYRLKQDSIARNRGTNAGSANDTNIPASVRAEDYFRNSRDASPDIGAVEQGGAFVSSTPTPIYSPTPIVTPNLSTTPTVRVSRTPTPRVSRTPTATVVNSRPPITTTTYYTSVCEAADSDNDGNFDITDFVSFAAAYQDGKRTCDDADVDYGPCGGRDVNADGVLNIADFGGTNGFASRYYPKTSCSLI